MFLQYNKYKTVHNMILQNTNTKHYTIFSYNILIQKNIQYVPTICLFKTHHNMFLYTYTKQYKTNVLIYTNTKHYTICSKNILNQILYFMFLQYTNMLLLYTNTKHYPICTYNILIQNTTQYVPTINQYKKYTICCCNILIQSTTKNVPLIYLYRPLHNMFLQYTKSNTIIYVPSI